ncbi:MAG: hypothetical protein ACK42E_00550, partial [Candidatus Bipolaricaulaceae bacterium]
GLLLALVRKGLGRREAHELVARLSAEAVRSGRSLAEVARAEPRVRERLTDLELAEVFSLPRTLRNVRVSFARVFSSGYNGPGHD